MKHNAEATLKEFGEYIGIPDLAFDEDNLCTLSFDDYAVSFSYREKTDQFLLYADIGNLPAPAPAPALTALLEANCLQPEGTAIGLRLDQERNVYVIALSALADVAGMNQDRFQKLIQDFLAVQEKWQERLPATLAENSSQTLPDNDYPPTSSIRA